MTSARWMLEDFPEGTFFRQHQVLATAVARLHVLLWARSARRVAHFFAAG